MLKKIVRGLLSIALVIVMGGLSIIEIGIEVVYQFIRLVRRGYGRLTSGLVKLVEPVYKGKLKLKIRHEERENDEIKIYEFTY